MVVPKAAATTGDYEVIAQDPLKYYFTSIEKKVRNLEKRKVKLDAYKKKVQDGETLDPDQKAAADKYEAVLGSLEFAKDLLKSLEVTMAEVSKIQKKNIRRETMVQEDKESWRVAFVMKATRVLEVMYNNKLIQDDFLNGTNGACILSAVEMKLLVEFYEVFVATSYEVGTNLIEDSASAANHLYELVEARNKSIMGTTYKELHALIDRICSLEYFEELQILVSSPNTQEPVKEKAEDDEVESASSLDADEEEVKEVEEELNVEEEENAEVEDTPVATETPEVSETISSPLDFTEEPTFLESKNFEASSLRSSSIIQDWANAPPPSDYNGDNVGQKMTFQYSGSEINQPEPAAPSILDVLAEVQGPCQFLQDSMIDVPSLSFMTQQQPQQMPRHGLEPVAFHSEVNSNLSTNNNMTNNSSTTNTQSYSSNSPPTIVQNTESTNQTIGLSHETLHGSQQHSRPSSISPKVQAFIENSAKFIQQNDSDNLGMGQTTFGKQQEHTQFTSENTNSYHRDGKNFSPFDNSGPASQEDQYDQQSNILSTEIAPEPPTTHIPLPNEQQSGYQSYLPTTDDVNEITKQEYNMQKPYTDNNTENEASELQNFKMSDSSPRELPDDDMVQSNYDSSNMDGANYQNNRQGNNRNNVSNRSRGYNNPPQGGYRSNSGGQINSGYRNNYRQRGFNGNYDSMGRPNYHNNGYHSGNGGQGGNYNNNYRGGNQDNMYMYNRRGGNSNGPRNNRGFGGQRGNNNRMSSNGYSRSRTFNRPQHQNEQHVN